VSLCCFFVEELSEYVQGDGTTPLHCAVLSSNPFVCSLLIQNGADVNLVDINGETPTQVAKRIGNWDTFYVCSGIPLSIGSFESKENENDGFEFKMKAKSNDLNRNPKTDLNPKSDSNSVSFDRCSEAIEIGDVSYFMQCDDSICFCLNENDDSILHLAILCFNLKIIQRLIDLNVPMNHQNKDGNTPLHFAVMFANPSNSHVIPYLISHGANIAIKNEYEQTPEMLTDDPIIKDLLKFVFVLFLEIVGLKKDRIIRA